MSVIGDECINLNFFIFITVMLKSGLRLKMLICVLLFYNIDIYHYFQI